MRSASLQVARPLAALTLVVGMVAAVVLPTPAGALGAGLVAAVLVILVASMAGSTVLVRAALDVGTNTRAALQRPRPYPAQSDPDGRGHARPRAPGALLVAV